MYKKLFKSISLSLIALLLLGFTFFFVGCKNKNENTNNTPPPSLADSIPASNVYKDIAQYVKTNGKLDTNGYYTFIIKGDKTLKKYIELTYRPNIDRPNADSLDIRAVDNAIGSFSLMFYPNADYSINNNLLSITYLFESKLHYDHITLPTTKFVDFNTTSKLTDVATFNETTKLTEEQQKQVLTQFSPLISEGLSELSNFYANTVKEGDSKYLGATYKYFYLPVIK